MRICLFIALLVMAACGSPQQEFSSRADKRNESRLLSFEYQGYGDTVCALLYGQVFQELKAANGKDTLAPLSGVNVHVEMRKDATVTDGSGSFLIGLPSGEFVISISRPGFEPLVLSNYVSDPDQVSTAKMVLVKGEAERIARLPERNDPRD